MKYETEAAHRLVFMLHTSSSIPHIIIGTCVFAFSCAICCLFSISCDWNQARSGIEHNDIMGPLAGWRYYVHNFCVVFSGLLTSSSHHCPYLFERGFD